MSIKLRNVAPNSMVVETHSHTDDKEYLRINKITIDKNGIVSGLIDFGRYGDNKVTRIECTVEGFAENENSDYDAKLIFKSPYENTAIYQLPFEYCDNRKFCCTITQDMLNEMLYYGLYNSFTVIMVLTEIDEEGSGPNNVINIHEQFVSGEFIGRMEYNSLADVQDVWTPTKVENTPSIEKDKITFTYEHEERAVHVNNTVFGNQYDSYVKCLEFDLVKVPWEAKDVTMIITNNVGNTFAYKWDGSLIWIPEEITAVGGDQQIYFKITDTKDRVFVSNQLTANVKSNWLGDEFFTWEIFITDQDNNTLRDKDDRILYAIGWR